MTLRDQGYSHRVVMSGRGMLHLLRLHSPLPSTMCGRSNTSWTKVPAESWEREALLGSPFVCTQCRGALSPNARPEP